MAVFSYQTNRVINGICEWCGIKAKECQHYKEHSLPVDEAKRLETGMPKPTKNVSVPPLTEEEKAKSIEEAEAKKEEFIKQEAAKEKAAVKKKKE
jgi:hypothetical protein